MEPFLRAVSPRRFSPRRFPSRALRRVRRTVLVYCCRVGLRVGTYSLWNSLRYGASLHTVLASCVTSRRCSEAFLRAVPLPGVFRAGKSPSRAQIAPRQAPQQRYRGLVWPLTDEIGSPNLVGALLGYFWTIWEHKLRFNTFRFYTFYTFRAHARAHQ